MNVSVDRVVNEVTIKIELPAAEVNKGFNKAVQKIAGQVNIPGFRKGKAPRKILERHVGIEAIKQEAFEIVANECYRKALDDEKLIPVGNPSVEESKFEENEDMQVVLKVVVKPEPKLGEYKGLTVEKKEAQVTDEEVDAAVEELRKRGAKMVAVPDAVIVSGDFAIIDFAGTVDGEPFSGGEGKGYPLEVGSGSFIPGFEEQLIGLKAGDSTDVNVTFPEEYFVKELAGKEAIFKVNVQDVKRNELPELNDEFVAANSDFATVEELKADYKEKMQKYAENKAQSDYERSVIQAAVNNAELEVPEIMVEDRIDQMIEELKLNLESRKMNLEGYLKYTGMEMDKLRETYQATALENVKTDLVLDAIAKAEDVQVNMEDVDAELATIANQNNAKVEEVKQIIASNGNMGLLLANILRRKAARIVLDSVVQ
ncbi:MAG TPA: trigger factor [Candidatus Avacidaminococcus intestinavium]|uniref:Trigger factor n=1 Tax=Candidatus Avacidaminococcus intestinavium TaxID=2840684 RepID=A0A9D1MPT2_9FIRM|nr:trigger factor [Candidatus Avacidaminococcus intestinavium]